MTYDLWIKIVRDRILVKRYVYLPFAKTSRKNIGKNVSKSLSNKYSQTLNGQLQIHLKLPQKEPFNKTVESSGDGQKIIDDLKSI